MLDQSLAIICFGIKIDHQLEINILEVFSWFFRIYPLQSTSFRGLGVSIHINPHCCGFLWMNFEGFLDQQSWFWKLHNGGSSLLYNWLIFGMLMRFCGVKLGFVAIWMWKTNTWFPPSNWGPSQSASVIPYRNYNNVSKAIIHHPYVVHSTRFAPHGKFWTGLLLRFTVTWWWQM